MVVVSVEHRWLNAAKTEGGALSLEFISLGSQPARDVIQRLAASGERRSRAAPERVGFKPRGAA